MCRCGGRPRSGAGPHSAACPQGGPSGSAALALGASVPAWGPGTVPLPCMSCGGLCAAGVVGGSCLGGGHSVVVRGAWRRAPSLFRPPVPEGGRPGPVAHVFQARVVWPWGTQHRLHSVLSCGPALRAVGAAGRRAPPGEGALRRCSGRLRSGARPLPGCRGPLPACCGRGCASVGV